MKLKSILDERNLTYDDLIKLMRKKGLKPVTADNISKIVKHNKDFMCSLEPRYGTGYPSTLERICLALEIKASDILGY